jgi:hypothetical protein
MNNINYIINFAGILKYLSKLQFGQTLHIFFKEAVATN